MKSFLGSDELIFDIISILEPRLPLMSSLTVDGFCNPKLAEAMLAICALSHRLGSLTLFTYI